MVVSVIYGMSRVKNESRWIHAVLTSMLPICEKIFVFDDHSDDATPAICKNLDKVDWIKSPFTGLNETLDKNYLLDRIGEVAQPGDMIIHIDGDEELAPGSCAQICAIANHPGDADAWKFQVLYLWDSQNQVRVDGCYANFRRPSLFRFRPGARFVSHQAGGFHCGNVPEPRLIASSGVQLWHYGYLHREDRLRKFSWYRSNDPGNASEDEYRHVVQGDIPEVPAHARLMHAGPLRLEPLGVTA